ncbi:MAG: ATP-dependent DNA helicase [Planctomycetaceae bacterium]|nr:MAG: ATP-dependent DNA helicase [Planctomycetaceae bacterium]
MAERLSHQLSERLGAEHVASHHGSLSAELRFQTEQRLKHGELKAVVATASLELGIDVGYIDLVVQMGSPRSVATFLQRIGRAGHSLHAIPKGRLFALTRDELVEAVALMRAVRRGTLDALHIPEKPLDILAQQIVAETAHQEWSVADLFACFRRAYPYRHLSLSEFEETLHWLSEGLSPRTGRRQALLMWNRVHGHIRARPAARLLAVSNGGAIPEIGNYRVVALPERTVIGSVDEDFAVESLRGDIFLLGNQSWRIEAVRQGEVLVSDAHGAPPSIPFWFGEAPGRTLELSAEVSKLRAEIWHACAGWSATAPTLHESPPLSAGHQLSPQAQSLLDELAREGNCSRWAAEQLLRYIQAQGQALGVVPTQQQVVFERFFDESGGMQLVIHAPFGSAINRAWGYALRKRFCRSFDFELQASADDDGIVLSLGPQHSFPLESLFSMLTSRNARGLLEQAILVQPPFHLRWRWNVTRALLVPRMQQGRKVPPALQRFRAEDLLTVVFPQLTGCQENHTGDIPIPDHPLVRQTLHDCLHEALDIDGLEQLLQRYEAGEITFIPRDTRSPSPFCWELLHAYPYAFLDPGEIQDRRARVVPAASFEAGQPPLTWLDPEALRQVLHEAMPEIHDADELHDLLLTVILFPEDLLREPSSLLPVRVRPDEVQAWNSWLQTLHAEQRVLPVVLGSSAQQRRWWVAIERWPVIQWLAPEVALPEGWLLPTTLPSVPDETAARCLVCRGWLEFCGPVSSSTLAHALGWDEGMTTATLEALEGEGSVLRGKFSPATGEQTSAEDQWCHRRLLARWHRLTLTGLRRHQAPVDPAVFQAFLWEHHGIITSAARQGANGLYETLAQLQGLDLPAVVWERDLLPLRLPAYQPAWLDELCLTGEVGWGRLYPPLSATDRPRAGMLTRVVPLSLFLRGDLPWLLPPHPPSAIPPLSSQAHEILELLQHQGALFAADILGQTRMLPTHLEEALGELISSGLVTSDSFAGMRSLIQTREAQSGEPRSHARWGLTRKRPLTTLAGRWSVWRRRDLVQSALPSEEEWLTAWSWQLIRRWGVVFRDLLAREPGAPPWWKLAPVLRRFEARGELRGGRFIRSVSGEQFTLEAHAQRLQALADQADEGPPLVISAADPLNLTGILTAPRIPALAHYRLLFRGGRLLASLSGPAIDWYVSLPRDQRLLLERCLREEPSRVLTARSPREKPAGRSPHTIPRPFLR